MSEAAKHSAYHGVRWDGSKERWRAEITLRANGRVLLLGLFRDEAAAARAVDDAALVLVSDGMVDRSTKRNVPHDTRPGGSKISPESLAALERVVAERRRMIKRSKAQKASASHARAPIDGPSNGSGARANGAQRPNAALASSQPRGRGVETTTTEKSKAKTNPRLASQTYPADWFASSERPAEERGKRWLGERVTPNERAELQKAIALSLAVPARRASRPADPSTGASAGALAATRVYRVGERVEVRFNGGAHYYDATITGETPQGFEVKYEDGDSEVNVKPSLIRPCPEPDAKRPASDESQQRLQDRISAREQEALDRALALSLAAPVRRASLKANASLSGSSSCSLPPSPVRPKPQKPARKGPKIAVCRPVLAKGALAGVAPPPPRAAALAATRALYMDGGSQLPRDEPPAGPSGKRRRDDDAPRGQPRARVRIDRRRKQRAPDSGDSEDEDFAISESTSSLNVPGSMPDSVFGFEVRQRKQATFFSPHSGSNAKRPALKRKQATKAKPAKPRPAKPKPKKVVQPRANDESWASETEESDGSDDSIDEYERHDLAPVAFIPRAVHAARDGAKVASGKSIGSLELVAGPSALVKDGDVSPPPPDTPTAQPTVGARVRVLLLTSLTNDDVVEAWCVVTLRMRALRVAC